MTSDSSSIIKKLLLLFLIVAGLYYAQVFLMPLCIAGILATLFLPFYKWMEKKKVPKALAGLICLLVLLLIITGIGAMLIWQISQLTKDFSMLTEKVIETSNHIQEFIFSNFGITPKKQTQMLSNEQLSITGIIQTVAGSLLSIFTFFILVLVYVFLFLYFRVHIRRFILKLATPSQQKEIGQVLTSVTLVSQQYLLGLAKTIGLLWIMYSIGFSLIGVKNPLFFAILCGMLEIVPYVGNITGTTLTLLVALVQGAGLPLLIGIVIIYMLIQAIQGWVLNPIILGSQVKINAFTTIISLVIGNLIWGIPGVFLAIPLIGMFKIVCDHFEPLKPYGFLIGEIETHKNKPDFTLKMMKWFTKKKDK